MVLGVCVSPRSWPPAARVDRASSLEAKQGCPLPVLVLLVGWSGLWRLLPESGAAARSLWRVLGGLGPSAGSGTVVPRCLATLGRGSDPRSWTGRGVAAFVLLGPLSGVGAVVLFEGSMAKSPAVSPGRWPQKSAASSRCAWTRASSLVAVWSSACSWILRRHVAWLAIDAVLVRTASCFLPLSDRELAGGTRTSSAGGLAAEASLWRRTEGLAVADRFLLSPPSWRLPGSAVEDSRCLRSWFCGLVSGGAGSAGLCCAAEWPRGLASVPRPWRQDFFALSTWWASSFRRSSSSSWVNFASGALPASFLPRRLAAAGSFGAPRSFSVLLSRFRVASSCCTQ